MNIHEIDRVKAQALLVLTDFQVGDIMHPSCGLCHLLTIYKNNLSPHDEERPDGYGLVAALMPAGRLYLGPNYVMNQERIDMLTLIIGTPSEVLANLCLWY